MIVSSSLFLLRWTSIFLIGIYFVLIGSLFLPSSPSFSGSNDNIHRDNHSDIAETSIIFRSMSNDSFVSSLFLCWSLIFLAASIFVLVGRLFLPMAPSFQGQ